VSRDADCGFHFLPCRTGITFYDHVDPNNAKHVPSTAQQSSTTASNRLLKELHSELRNPYKDGKRERKKPEFFTEVQERYQLEEQDKKERLAANKKNPELAAAAPSKKRSKKRSRPAAKAVDKSTATTTDAAVPEATSEHPETGDKHVRVAKQTTPEELDVDVRAPSEDDTSVHVGNNDGAVGDENEHIADDDDDVDDKNNNDDDNNDPAPIFAAISTNSDSNDAASFTPEQSPAKKRRVSSGTDKFSKILQTTRKAKADFDHQIKCIDNLKDQLAKRNLHIVDIERQKTDLNSQIAQLRAQVAARKEADSRLDRNLMSYGNEITNNRNEIKRINDVLAERNTQVETLNAQIDTLTKRNMALMSEQDLLRAGVEASKACAAQASATAAAEKDELGAELNKALAVVAKQKTDIEALDQTIVRHITDMRNMTNSINSQSQKLAQKDRDLKAMEATARESAAQAERHRQRADRVDKELTALKAKISSTSGDNDAKDLELVGRQKTINDLTKKLEEVKKHEEAKQQQPGWQARHLGEKPQNKHAEGELEAKLKTALAKIEALEPTVRQLVEAKARIAELDQEVQRRKTEIAEARQEWRDASNLYSESKAQMQAIIDDHKNQLANTQHALRRMSDTNEEDRLFVIGLMEEIACKDIPKNPYEGELGERHDAVHRHFGQKAWKYYYTMQSQAPL